MKKRVFITGIAGQDGSYLAEYLLEKEYEIFGLVRYTTTGQDLTNLQNCISDIKIIEGDLIDENFLRRTIATVRPHEIYNLGSQSHVGKSFDIPDYTTQTTAIPIVNILEAVKESNFNSKVYQASTSELFGDVFETPQTENTRFNPRSPYAVSKLYAHYMVKVYREAYNIFACSGILFNHESPRRGLNFVTQKVCREVVRIVNGRTNHIELGNIDAKRDWGHARDYVRGMYMMLQQTDPDDYILATGKLRSVRDLLEVAFSYFSLNYEDYITINPEYFRPSDVNILLGNSKKATEKLGWVPLVSFEEMIHEMIEHQQEIGR